MNSESFKNISAGLKNWVYIILVLVIAVILFMLYKGIRDRKDTELQKHTAYLQQQLKQAIEQKAKGSVVYVPHTVKQYVYITQTTNVPKPVQLAKDDLCNIAKQNNIAVYAIAQNDAVYCRTNLCDPADALIKVKAAFYTDVTHIEAHNNTVWRLSGVFGGQLIVSPVQTNLSLGMSFLDWHSIIAGVNAGFNFKRLSDTNAGLFVGWRPEILSRALNASLDAGYAYGVHGGAAQVLLLFHFWN